MDFREFLITSCKVPSHMVGYYLNWVSSYNNFRRHNCDSDINDFCTSLKPKFQDWQIKQAEKAINFYIYFRNTFKNTNSLARSECLSKWDNIILKIRGTCRMQHKSYSTEKSYIHWIKRFVKYLGNKNPSDSEENDVKNFLTYLAVEKGISESTQKQAFIALLFLYRHILFKEITNLDNVVHSTQYKKLPLVLSVGEIVQVFAQMNGIYKTMVEIIYGGGLRLSECLSLRIRDIDFPRECITVRSGKGNKDRQTLLPNSIKTDLQEHIADIRKYYDSDRQNKIPGVQLPFALENKYLNAGKEWGWFWVFPSSNFQMIQLIML